MSVCLRSSLAEWSHGAGSSVQGGCGIPFGDRGEVVGVGGDGEGGGFGVDQEGFMVEVGHVVSRGVVVGVVGHAGLTPPAACVLFGHDALGAREESTGRNAVQDKGLVVGTSVKLGGDMRQVDGVVVVLEQFLDLGGTGRSALVERRSITVIDHEGVVGRGDHVEVQVQSDLVQLGGIQMGDVVVAAQQTELLCCPEEEAHGILDGVLRERFGNDQVANNARAIVVDTRARLD